MMTEPSNTARNTMGSPICRIRKWRASLLFFLASTSSIQLAQSFAPSTRSVGRFLMVDGATTSSVADCRPSCWRLSESPHKGDDERNDDAEFSEKSTVNTDHTSFESFFRDKNEGTFSSILSRFTSPRLDDPFLPLSDAGVAQIMAPSLQIAWLASNQAPAPTWLQPVFGTSQLIGNGAGSLLAPTLIHGAALATCWLVGALAARAYERDAIAVNPVTKSYATVIRRVVQAGCFATGLLILATQFDIYTEYGYVQLGDSPETDFRLQVALIEGVNDVFFEAITLLTWRLYLAFQSSKRLQ